MATYNVNAYGIPSFDYIKGIFDLEYTNHAFSAAKNDRYGNFSNKLEYKATLSDDYLIEVEFNNGVPVKYIYRFPYNNKLDICLVLRHTILSNRLLVVTLWFNATKDRHNTLNLSNYDKINDS